MGFLVERFNDENGEFKVRLCYIHYEGDLGYDILMNKVRFIPTKEQFDEISKNVHFNRWRKVNGDDGNFLLQYVFYSKRKCFTMDSVLQDADNKLYGVVNSTLYDIVIKGWNTQFRLMHNNNEHVSTKREEKFVNDYEYYYFDTFDEFSNFMLYLFFPETFVHVLK